MKNLLLILLLIQVHTAFSQDAGSLLKLHDFADKTTIDAITSPIEGSIVYNNDNKKPYYFNGTDWIPFYIAPTVIDKTADYTLTTTDDGNIITFPGNADYTLTIPTGLSKGFNISVYQKDDGTANNGNITIISGGATIINRLDRFITAGDGAGLGIIALEDDVFYITGDLKKI